MSNRQITRKCPVCGFWMRTTRVHIKRSRSILKCPSISCDGLINCEDVVTILTPEVLASMKEIVARGIEDDPLVTLMVMRENSLRQLDEMRIREEHYAKRTALQRIRDKGIQCGKYSKQEIAG